MQSQENNTEGREISISRLFNAPIDLVWKVWTDPEHVKNWWGPNGFTNTITKMDVKPGGEWNLVMHGPDGTDYKNKSIFKEVVLHKKLVYEHISGPKFLATIFFESQGNKTFIKWQMLFDTKEELMQVVKTFKADEGLKQNIEKLNIYLQNNLLGNLNFTSGYTEVNGLNMYYEIYGNGQPLVLIHGGGSTIQTSFGRIIPQLAKRRQIIAVELQVHGRTNDRDTPSSFQQDADDVAKLLQNLQIAKADFLGFSNGGHTTFEIAIRHPNMINKIILCSTFYKRSEVYQQFWENMNKATFNDMPQIYKDEFLKINNDQTALLKMFKRDASRMKTFSDWSDEQIRSIKTPALIICGDKDVNSVEHATEMYRMLANSQLAIIPGGHGKYLGEITTLIDGEWTQDYITPLIEQFLNE
jgi:pimeloyl-ACP methyl ester carboxylesterase/uncharacterized protein YndB with AHSA1/START domain